MMIVRAAPKMIPPMKVPPAKCVTHSGAGTGVVVVSGATVVITWVVVTGARVVVVTTGGVVGSAFTSEIPEVTISINWLFIVFNDSHLCSAGLMSLV